MTEKKKFIRRADHSKENPYVMVRRDTLQDVRLSYEARGMLGYILSQPDDWRVEPSELINDHCGRDKVYRILKELIEAKYIEHERSQDKDGKIRWGDYVVHESPLRPFPEKPYTANPDSKDSLNNKEGSAAKAAPHLRTTKIDDANVTQLISAWVSACQFVDMGQSFATNARKAKAREMLRWSKPVTCEEIKEFTSSELASGRKAPEFSFLPDKIGLWRSTSHNSAQSNAADMFKDLNIRILE